MPARDWSAKVERLCEKLASESESEVAALTRKARKQRLSKAEYAARVLELSADAGEPYVEDMGALAQPEGREKQATRFVALQRRALILFADVADALKQGDARYAKSLNEDILDVAVESRKLARQLDVEGCIPNRSRGLE